MSLTNSCLKIIEPNADILIVSFAGHDKMFGLIQRFMFVHFLQTHFSFTSRYFYVDKYMNSYHNGIDGISKTIDETVKYLKREIIGYKKVIFLGVSSGGYAAILFGSLVNITYVLAFMPQTIRRNITGVDEKYRDISGYICDTTQYYLYADTSVTEMENVHHISHCDRISHHPNVFVIKKQGMDLREMRDTGELFKIMNNIVIK